MNDADASTPGDGPSTPGESRSGESRPSPYRSFVAAAVLALLGLLATAGFKSYRDLQTVRAHERKLLGEIAAAEERIRVLNAHIGRIENDPATLERLAREELGMVREGDVVIVLPEDEPGTDRPGTLEN